MHQYTDERWDIERVHALTNDAPNTALRDYVLLRVANEIDEHLDGAMRLDPKRADSHISLPRWARPTLRSRTRNVLGRIQRRIGRRRLR